MHFIGPTEITIENGPHSVAQIGTEAVLHCIVNYAPIVQVHFHWTKDGQPLNDSQVKTKQFVGGRNVIFEQARYEDEGEYQCTVRTTISGQSAPEVKTIPTAFRVIGTYALAYFKQNLYMPLKKFTAVYVRHASDVTVLGNYVCSCNSYTHNDHVLFG